MSGVHVLAGCPPVSCTHLPHPPPPTHSLGVPLVRRFTGGGTVVVDANTTLISFICNKDAAVGSPSFPRELMAWSSRFYSPLFASLLPPPAPPFSLAEHDYALGDKKVGGNAQTLSRDRWVHHTSFLWDYDPSLLGALLKMPARAPSYRGGRPHSEFVTRLRGLPGAGGSAQGALPDAVVAALVAGPGGAVEVGQEVVEGILAASTERVATVVL